MKNGLLWALVLIFVYLNMYFLIGFIFIWNSTSEFSTLSAISLLASSIAYLILGIITFLLVLLTSIFLAFKDSNIRQTVNKHWPLIFAIIYWILPDFMPGPIDDIILAAISVALETYFWQTSKKILN